MKTNERGSFGASASLGGASGADSLPDDAIHALLLAREQVRSSKNFAAADALREQLRAGT